MTPAQQRAAARVAQWPPIPPDVAERVALLMDFDQALDRAS